ncbi:MAG TPA: GNAT family N-acetyltransferase, partial [Caulifigura sp.]|nr:GNAT family N-acetyltransferase [Caulifigura sp.]
MLIRPIQESERPGLWKVMQHAVRAGETLAVPTNATPDEAVNWWAGGKEAVFVADDGGQILGSYYLRPNQAGNASHIVNAGYVVAESARGRGLASALCRHSLEEARRRGYLAMQFN